MINNYHYYISNKYLIIALKPTKKEDLSYFKDVLNKEKEKFSNVILELNSYQIMDEFTVNFINKIINFFKMYDIKTFVAGIQAETAYFLSNLDAEINAKIYLNLDKVMINVK